MHQRTLGTDGPSVSAIGFGAWPIGGGMGAVDEAAAIAAVRTALDSGITLIDTAQYYRSSEAVIGKALKDGWRDKAFIATKVSFDFTRAGIASALDDSLRALGVDAVDLYQVHTYDPSVPQAETMGMLAELQRAGKVKAIGVSNYDPSQMQEAWAVTPYAANQIAYNMIDRQVEAEDIPWCEAQGVGVLAHSVLAKGALSGRYQPGHTFPPDDERARFPRFQGAEFARRIATAEALKPIAADLGLTLVQLAIAWTLRKPVVGSVLVGPKSVEQVMDYLPAADVTLDGETLGRIEAIL